MAGNLTNKNYETSVCEFYIDTIGEIDFLPTTTKKATGDFLGNPNFEVTPSVGSTCTVGNNGDLTVYILTGTGWTEI